MSYARTLSKLSAFQIRSGADSIPYSVDNIPYVSSASNGTNVKSALDWLFAVLYPNTKPNIDTKAELPLIGNDINDYRIVLDDGDGKPAGYRWWKKEGDTEAKWYKIHDMDWSNDAILASFMDQTQDLFIYRNGSMEVDEDGTPLTGNLAGQHLYGGTDQDSNLTLHPNSGDESTNPSDQTGFIQLNGHTRPLYDDAYDIGDELHRVRDLFFTGSLTDGDLFTTLSEILYAIAHADIIDGNPHNTEYDDLNTKLGTVTLDGDATGSLDLSTSGNKTLTVTVNDDSHEHSTDTITGLDEAIYDFLKVNLVDNDNVSWVFDDVEMDIEADVSIDLSSIPSFDMPEADNILVSNAIGDKWIKSNGQIDLTGDVTGSGTFNSTTGKWEIETEAIGGSLSVLSDVNLTNKEFTSSSGYPTTVTAVSHGFTTGDVITMYGSELAGPQTVTVVNPNEFTVDTTTLFPDSGHYIPQGGQILWDATEGKFVVAREHEGIALRELSDLNEDVLTQYVNKNGRNGGQTVHGDTASGGDLYLDSTAHTTKGSILLKSKLSPDADASIDLGGSTKRFKDTYLSGQVYGLRPENVSSLPVPSGSSIGRTVYYDAALYVDTGSKMVKVGSSDVNVYEASSNYTATVDNDVILCNCTSSDITITLPDASTYKKKLTIKHIGGTNTATITGALIDGESSMSIFSEGVAYTLVTNGTGWFVI